MVRRRAARAPRLTCRAAMAGMASGGRFADCLYLLTLWPFRSPVRLSAWASVSPSAGPPVRLASPPPRPYSDQRADHLPGALEHSPGVVVAQQLQRLGERTPLAGGN